MEHIMRCKVCSKTWSFTDADVSDSKIHAASTAISAIGEIAAAFGGSALDMYALDKQTEKESKRIVDFSHCPFCKSSYIEEISLQQLQESQQYSHADSVQPRLNINANASVDALIIRTRQFIENGEFDTAAQYCEYILDASPENGEVYFLKALIENKFRSEEDFVQNEVFISNSKYYKQIIRYGNKELLERIEQIDQAVNAQINNRLEAERFSKYNKTVSSVYAQGKDLPFYIGVAVDLLKFGNYYQAPAQYQKTLHIIFDEVFRISQTFKEEKEVDELLSYIQNSGLVQTNEIEEILIKRRLEITQEKKELVNKRQKFTTAAVLVVLVFFILGIVFIKTYRSTYKPFSFIFGGGENTIHEDSADNEKAAKPVYHRVPSDSEGHQKAEEAIGVSEISGNSSIAGPSGKYANKEMYYVYEFNGDKCHSGFLLNNEGNDGTWKFDETDKNIIIVEFNDGVDPLTYDAEADTLSLGGVTFFEKVSDEEYEELKKSAMELQSAMDSLQDNPAVSNTEKPSSNEGDTAKTNEFEKDALWDQISPDLNKIIQLSREDALNSEAATAEEIKSIIQKKDNNIAEQVELIDKIKSVCAGHEEYSELISNLNTIKNNVPRRFQDSTPEAVVEWLESYEEFLTNSEEAYVAVLNFTLDMDESRDAHSEQGTEDSGSTKISDKSKSSDQAKYEKAYEFFNVGDYKSAQNTFAQLGTYSDSKNMALESEYLYAKQLLKSSTPPDRYVVDKCFEHLIAEHYKDSFDIYDQLDNDWKATVLLGSWQKYPLDSIHKDEDLDIRCKVFAKRTLSYDPIYEFTFPNGEVETGKMIKYSSWWSYQGGIWEDPASAPSGTFTVRVLDSSGNVHGEASIYIGD